MNANILVLFDRSPGYDRSEDNKSTSDLFYITKNPKNMNDDIIKHYGELDMTNPDVLYEFLSISNTYFPSKHTILNIWSHGRGVYPDGVIPKAVVEDYTTGYGVKNMMSIFHVGIILSKFKKNFGKKIDILQFDACDMQMIEIAYQFKNAVDYIVGPDTQIPGGGSDYKAIAEYLEKNNFDKEDFPKFLVESFYNFEKNSGLNFSYCALKTSILDDFLPLFNDFCFKLKNMIEVDGFLSIIDVREDLELIDSGYREFCDLAELLYRISDTIDVNGLLQILNILIVESKSTFDDSKKIMGLGINFPSNREEMLYYYKDDSEYSILDFYKDSSWDEFLYNLFVVMK